ncbi:MAG TPA: hypothetical protein VER04_21695 [Polyangiaceae bacterium]|jgi:hypothetical protein|nr:hypothetical protein [Polyangiaceae bacterium]
MLGKSFGSAVAVAVLGCASGPVKLVGYQVPQRQQVAIVIDISEQVNQADDSGAVATLAETVASRLKENGIDSQLYASKYDHPKPPRVDIFVSNWRGTPTLSHLGAVVGPLGLDAWNKIVVDCKVTLPGQDKVAFSQHFEHTSLAMTGSTDQDLAAAESVGDAIVNAILKR